MKNENLLTRDNENYNHNVGQLNGDNRGETPVLRRQR